jgi:hypothetical protein
MITINKSEARGDGQTRWQEIQSEAKGAFSNSTLVRIGYVLASLAVGLALWVQHHKQTEQTALWRHTIAYYSNQVASLDHRLAQEVGANAALETSLAATKLSASNSLASPDFHGKPFP